MSGSVKKLMHAAELAENEGNFRDAARCWQRLLGLQPNNIWHWISLGRVQRELGDIDGALQSFEHARKIDPDNPSVYGGKGMCLRRLGRNEEALREFETYVRLKPCAWSYVFLGETLAALDRIEGAEAAFRTALEHEPNYEEAYFNLAILCFDLRSSERLEYLHKAIELDPKYADAYRELGWALTGSRRFRQGEKALRKAIELNFQDRWAHVQLANNLSFQGRKGEEEEELATAAKIAPSFEVAYWLRGNFYSSQGDTTVAEQLFRKAIELSPDDAISMYFYAKFLAHNGRVDAANEWLDKCLAIDPSYQRAIELKKSVT